MIGEWLLRRIAGTRGDGSASKGVSVNDRESGHEELLRHKKFETIFAKTDGEAAQLLLDKVIALLQSDYFQEDREKFRLELTFVKEVAKQLSAANRAGFIPDVDFGFSYQRQVLFDSFKQSYETEKYLPSLIVPEEISYKIKWLLVNGEIHHELEPEQEALQAMISRSDEDLAGALDFALRQGRFPITDLMVAYFSFTDWEHNRQGNASPLTVETQKHQAQAAIVQLFSDSGMIDEFKRGYLSDEQIKNRSEQFQALDDYDLLKLVISFFEDCRISHPAETKFLATSIKRWFRDASETRYLNTEEQKNQTKNHLAHQFAVIGLDGLVLYKHKLSTAHQDKPPALLTDGELFILATEKLQVEGHNYTIAQHLQGLVLHHMMSGSFKVASHREALLAYIQSEHTVMQPLLEVPNEVQPDDTWEDLDEAQPEAEFVDQSEEFNEIRILIADMIDAYGIDPLLIEPLEMLNASGLITQIETIRDELLSRLTEDRMQIYSVNERTTFRNAAFDADMLIHDIQKMEVGMEITRLINYINKLKEEYNQQVKEREVTIIGLIGEIKLLLNDFSRHTLVHIDVLAQAQKSIWYTEKKMADFRGSHTYMQTTDDFGSDHSRYVAAEWNRTNSWILDQMKSDLSAILLLLE